MYVCTEKQTNKIGPGQRLVLNLMSRTDIKKIKYRNKQCNKPRGSKILLQQQLKRCVLTWVAGVLDSGDANHAECVVSPE